MRVEPSTTRTFALAVCQRARPAMTRTASRTIIRMIPGGGDEALESARLFLFVVAFLLVLVVVPLFQAGIQLFQSGGDAVQPLAEEIRLRRRVPGGWFRVAVAHACCLETEGFILSLSSSPSVSIRFGSASAGTQIVLAIHHAKSHPASRWQSTDNTLPPGRGRC